MKNNPFIIICVTAMVLLLMLSQDSEHAAAADFILVSSYNHEYRNSSLVDIPDAAPTGISLSSDSVAENKLVGTAVGTFTTTDPDGGDIHTYTLVAGAGDTDNGSFTIAVNQLKTAEIFDYETQTSYSIHVLTEDDSGGTFDKSFIITINDANDPPTVSDVDKSGNEDNDILFTASDFTGQFNDEDADILNKIKVTSLPLNGTLELNASPVSANDEIVTAGLSNLSFIPDTNWHGDTSFGWNGHDGTVYATDGAVVNITIHPINDAPTVSDVDKSGNEDNDIPFAALDFTDQFDDEDGDSLIKIMVTLLPLNGTLKLNGLPISVDDEIVTAGLSNLSFIPDANWHGDTSFGWNGHDGTVYATDGAVVNITIHPINDAPTVSDVDKSGNEDNDIPFAVSDFTDQFDDEDGDTLNKIKVTSLPLNGTLELNASPVSANDEIVTAGLSNLSFIPDANWHGDTSFGWNGHDGTVYATDGAVVNITIHPINDAPTVSDVDKSGNEDNDIPFAVSDFTDQFDDEDGDTLNKIKVTSLPLNGTLELNASPVSANEEIVTAGLNDLSFIPDANWHGDTSFGWNGHDGTVYATDGAVVNITIHPINGAPTVSDVDKSGNEDNDIPFAALDFTDQFDDEDGDTLNKIKVTSLPLNGTLELNASPVSANEEIVTAGLNDLSFIPDANWHGDTSFGWNGHDGTVYATDGAVVNITIHPINDAPTVSDVDKSGNEDNNLPFAMLDFTDQFDDVDDDALNKIMVTSLPANGTLKLSGFPVVVNDEIVTADLNNLTFTPNTNWHGDTSFGWNGHDGTVYADGAMVNITIHSVNDTPEIDLNGSQSGTDFTATFAAGYGPVTIVDTDLRLTDVDNTTLHSATVTLTNNPDGAAERLAAGTSGTNIIASYDAGDGELNLSGEDTVANYQQVMRTVTYDNTRQNPDNTPRTVEFVINDGEDDSNVASAIVHIINPNIAIAKTPDTQGLVNGGTASFTIAITNTGDVNLDDIIITDPLTDDCGRDNLGILLPGGSLSYTCSRPNVTADFLNEAAVTSLDPLGNAVTDTDTAFVDIHNPNIAIFKNPGSQTIKIGGTASFNIVVVNTSTVADLVNVKVSDPFAPDCNRVIGDLAANEDYDYSCQETDVTAFFRNYATVIGTNAASNGTVSDSDYADVDVLDITIDISVEPPSLPEPGGSVEFTIVVTNDSSKKVTLTSLESDYYGELTDPGNTTVQNNSCIPNPAPPILAANGGIYTCSFMVSVTGVSGESKTHTIVASGDDGDGNTVDDSDQATITITADVDVLDITIDISVEPPSLPEPGGSVEFTIVVTNDSSKKVTLTSLESDYYGELTDPGNTTVQNNSCIPNPAPPILAANGGIYTCSFMVSVTGVSGESETHTIMASGDDGDDNIIDDSDQATITITDPSIFTQFLPVVFNHYIPGEPNDRCTEAYPITTKLNYYFLADDVDDWYQFDLPNSGNLAVELTNFVPVEGQITAWRETEPGNCRSLLFLGNNGDFSSTKILDLGLQPAGHYYIWLINDGPINTVDPYKLRVRFP